MKTGYFSVSTFTGKERDEETGYGYFGARYMDHELMTMWLSVDPMANKYPSISPYAYCAWNPVRLVDPNGEDIWEIDINGNVINRIEDNTKEVFFIVDGNGNRDYDKTISFDHICINSFYSKNEIKYNCKFDSYEINGDEEGRTLFEFLSENTCVEWSHFILGEKELDECNLLTTSHLEDQDKQPFSIAKKIRDYDYNLREFNHCHQNGNPNPSGTGGENGDLVLAKWINDNISKNVLFNIYTPRSSTKYHPYDRNYINKLKPIIVTGKKP